MKKKFRLLNFEKLLLEKETVYENDLNHISIAVVQFKLLQAIDKSDFVLAKELVNLLKKNYHRLVLQIQKLSVIFDILYSDIVIDSNMTNFSRHYKWITEKDKLLCTKYDNDAKYFYDIYTKIFNKDYNIEELVLKLINSDDFASGEKLSMRKRFDFLIEKLYEL